MNEFSQKNSLGNQSWWHIVRYLILIGDWPAALGMMSPWAYVNQQRKHKKAMEE